MDTYKELYNKEAPQEMRKRRSEVVAELKTPQVHNLCLAVGHAQL